jgi:subtilisin
MIQRIFLLFFTIFIINGMVHGSASAADRNVIIGFHQSDVPSEQKLVKDNGGKLKKTFHLINAVSANMSDTNITKLKKDPRVAYVENDSIYRVADEYTNSWGVQHIGSQIVHNQGIYGAGVKIAVLDTGIDYNHEDLKDNYKGGIGFVQNPDYSVNPSNYDDTYLSHGTHVAGIIAAQKNGIGVIGVAPNASIYAIKVLDGSGSGMASWIIAGIEWAVANNMNIVTMSFTGTENNIALQEAVDNAYNSGILLVAAGGNTKGGAVTYPAAYESVIAVSAIDANNQKASFSSVGPEIELAAPGVDIYSTVKGGYALMSGTSMAAPHVTGVAALVYSTNFPDVNGDGFRNNKDVREILHNTKDLGIAGKDNTFGYGLVDASMSVPEIPVPQQPPNPPPVSTINLTFYNTETDCRSCHGITVDRHHLLVANGTHQCMDCHVMKYDNQSQTYYPEVIRSCLTCHVGKDHTDSHHLLVAQGLFVCTDCHAMKYDNQSQTYYPEIIWDCTVCHSTVLSRDSAPVPAPTVSAPTVSAPVPTPGNPPTIIQFSPGSPPNDVVGASRKFEITIDQTANIVWYINGNPVQSNDSVIGASYSKTSATAGIWNVDAIATNTNGSVMRSWTWNVMIDHVSPEITINSPVNGRIYLLHQSLIANWSVSDVSSGIATATGTYPSGSAINTNSVGTKNFSVYAKDNAGNTNIKNVTYYIRYNFGGFLEPINKDGSSIFKQPNKVSIKFQLRDANGNYVNNAVAKLNYSIISPKIIGKYFKSSTTDPATNGGVFKYNSKDKIYFYNLETKGLASGTWQLRVDINDGSSNTVNISLQK